MKIIRYKAVLLAVCFVMAAVTGAFGQTVNDLRFEVLSTTNGLSSSSVSGICQGSVGYLWFGTQAGLNRYDGKTIKVYENEPFNDNSLVHNQIQTIYTDFDGSLWIGTYGGLSHLDPVTDTFTTYTHESDNPSSLSNNVVVAISRDDAGSLWAGTLDGLNRLDETSGTFTIYKNDPGDPSSLPNNVVRDLHCDTQGRLWIGTYGGLSLYDTQNNGFITRTPGDGHGVALGSPFVMTITEDPAEPGILYLGTWNGGLCRFDTRFGTSELFTLPDLRVYSTMIDSSGRLWIGTWGGGLFLFSRKTGNMYRYALDMQDSIPNDIVYSIFEDNSGILWIGTNGGGVAKLVDWHNQYRYFRHDDTDPDSLPAGKVTIVFEDSRGRVWYGIYNQGLHRQEKDSDTLRHYRHDGDDPFSLSDDIVNRIYEDPDGRIWICSNGGIDLYDEAEDAFLKPYSEIGGFPVEGTVFYDYFEDSRGDIWLGTYTEGLYRHEPDRDVYTRFSVDEPEGRKITDNLIRKIFEDSLGIIWIGTNNGLNRYNPESGSLQTYSAGRSASESISHGNIRDIKETGDGKLLIATMGGGVSIYDLAEKTFTHLTTRDGLASNMVRAVLLRENLWYFATQVGVSVYDPATGSFTTMDENSGLLSNELSDGQMIDSNGTFYFGCMKGVTIVSRPQQVPTGPPPPIVVTGITVLGEPADVTTNNGPEIEPISLPYRHNTISVEFAALDFADPGNNQYSVKLEGMDKEWQAPSRRNYVSYSGLPPGKYRLMIRGAGSRNNWNTEGISLPISVQLPWWQTKTAFGLYSLLFVAGLALILLLVKKKQRKTREHIALQEAHARELEKKVRERTSEIEEARKQAEEATKAKSIFMATMSHEIRTPLNGISGMLTLLKRTPLNEEQKNYIDHTQTAANSLFTLVNDALDLERIMSGHLTIEKAPFSLIEITNFISGIYGPQAADQGIDFQISLSGDLPDSLLGDRARITQIITNLVSNAIKYTDEGRIDLAIENAGKATDREITVRISVSDSGPGIPDDKREAIFDQFYQLSTSYTKRSKGVGLGLSIVKQLCSLMNGDISVHSVLGKGTRFTVLLPLDRIEEEKTQDIHTETQPLPGMNGGPKHILLAEDEAINRLFIQRILESRGFMVTAVSNGREAADTLESGGFSLAFMDLGMPVLGGLEATREIRKHEKRNGLPRLPIIALTAYAYQSDIESCREAGMDDFISKPLNEGTLFRKIEEWTNPK